MSQWIFVFFNYHCYFHIFAWCMASSFQHVSCCLGCGQAVQSQSPCSRSHHCSRSPNEEHSSLLVQSQSPCCSRSHHCSRSPNEDNTHPYWCSPNRHVQDPTTVHGPQMKILLIPLGEGVMLFVLSLIGLLPILMHCHWKAKG